MARLNVGLIGLGRMGLSIAWRLVQAGHSVFGFDFNKEVCDRAKKIGVNIVDDVPSVLQKSRIVWLMVPAGKPVDDVIALLEPALQKGDIIIDGGNSHFEDSVRRHDVLLKKEVFFLDCGTSGGLHGKEKGFSLMVGGELEAYKKAMPLFQIVACGNGVEYMGPSGAGHYVKMIHNGIEYALLQSYAEGFNLLKHGHYQNLDLEKISRVWLHGSIIRSWILELSHEIFKSDQAFKDVSGSIGENLTGYWSVEEAKKRNIPVDLIEKSLAIRAWSRQTGGNYATKMVALLRKQFGGHEVKKEGSGT